MLLDTQGRGRSVPDLEQWREELARWGLARFLHSRVMSALQPWLTLCRVHSRPQDPSIAPPSPGTGRRVGFATRDELRLAARDPEMALRPGDVDAALARGDVCVATFEGERMIAYVWRSFSTAPHRDGLWVEFDPPFMYGYKALTHPDYRGQHLQDAVSRTTDALCIARGRTRGISFIESHNYPSIASDLRRGNRLVAWAGYLTLFGRVYPFRSPGARWHTFRFVRRA